MTKGNKEDKKQIKKTAKKAAKKVAKKAVKKEMLTSEMLLQASQLRPTKNVGALTDQFIERMVYPDLYGGFRIPRQGANTKTGVWEQRGTFTITGSGTLQYQGVCINSGMDGNMGYTFSSNANGTAFGAGTAVPAAVNFPPISTMVDATMNACCIVITYLGNPLNVAGSLILGTVPWAGAFSNPCALGSFGSLFYNAGTLNLPLTEVMKQGSLRVSGLKASNQSDEFVTIATPFSDWELPYVVFSGLPTTCSVQIDVFKVGEYRNAISPGNLVLYEKATQGYSGDLDAWQNAISQFGESLCSVSEGLSHTLSQQIGSLARGVAGGMTQSILNAGGTAAMRLLHGARHEQLRQRHGILG